ncbi:MULTISPECIES: hypothetical protein [Pseudomonas]|nr:MULTISPECIES: hypothetical protein [Pseudomonas]SHI35798.1 hypothetical protein SAMN05216295_101367 [Pseudomonas zeshuii]
MSYRYHRRRRTDPRSKTVYVHRYSRYRYGRWEDVTDHFRSPPNQLSFDF